MSPGVDRTSRTLLMDIKERVHQILEVDESGDNLSQAVDTLLMLLIVTNVAALVISTDQRIYSYAPRFFFYFEAVSFGIFGVEYLLRLWACTADPDFSHPITGRIRFALHPLMLADGVAVVSYYVLLLIPPTLGLDLGAFRALRLVGRMARLARYSPGLQALGTAVAARKDELLAVVSVLGVLLVLASSLMYFVERTAQPDKFSSIPETMWWSIITVTTVGYGDVAPVTPVGRLLAGMIALLGIGIFALPAGILGSSFMEQVNRRRNRPVIRTCPHCGRDIDESPQQ